VNLVPEVGMRHRKATEKDKPRTFFFATETQPVKDLEHGHPQFLRCLQRGGKRKEPSPHTS